MSSVLLPALVVGDTVEFLTAVEDYPPSDGWTFKIRIAPRAAGATAFTLTATTSPDADEFLIQVAPAVSALWTAASYSWTAWVEKVGARYTIDSGLIEILPDQAAATTSDLRTHSRIVLEAIEAVIEGRATKDQQEYTIGSRSLKRTSLQDLREMHSYYANKVAAEEAEDRLDAGLVGGRRLYARL